MGASGALGAMESWECQDSRHHGGRLRFIALPVLWPL
jgi:hypothetical protein